ncbi:hypothetical protein [Methylosinus sp. PW1]|nr:hypothetical protein [Methylosinus sp. PW1]
MSQLLASSKLSHRAIGFRSFGNALNVLAMRLEVGRVVVEEEMR